MLSSSVAHVSLRTAYGDKVCPKVQLSLHSLGSDRIRYGERYDLVVDGHATLAGCQFEPKNMTEKCHQRRLLRTQM